MSKRFYEVSAIIEVRIVVEETDPAAVGQTASHALRDLFDASPEAAELDAYVAVVNITDYEDIGAADESE